MAIDRMSDKAAPGLSPRLKPVVEITPSLPAKGPPGDSASNGSDDATFQRLALLLPSAPQRPGISATTWWRTVKDQV